MTMVVIYETTTGMIRAAARGGAGSMPVFPDCEELILGEEVDLSNCYIDQGVVTFFPPKPSSHHVWDWATKAWVDPRTLSEIQDAQWAEVRAARDAAEAAGFTWNGYTFDSDPLSQQRIQGAALQAYIAQQASQPFSIDWTLADNTVRTLSATEMIAVGIAMGEHIDAIHAQGRVLRAAIEAATTPAEVEAVVWS